MKATLRQRLAAEFIGTAFLLATVVGSGIMAERLAGGNAALALLANSVATGAVLIALILAFGVVSSHFNPVVTVCEAVLGLLPTSDVFPYVLVQVAGALLGVATANLMFGLPCFFVSQKMRSGLPQCFSESIATFGLVVVIFSCARLRPQSVAAAVAAYITAAYWITASTSFANPAVTLARTLSDTFAGIRPQDAPWFILAQCVGAVLALAWVSMALPQAEGSTS